MNTQIDSQKLLPLIKAFYELTGMKLAIYDTDFEEVLTYPETSCDFCQALWRHCGGREKCDRYTAAFCRKCAGLNKTLVYTCHAGLTEVVSPLTENETVLGYAVCGQVTNQPDRKVLEQDVRNRCSGMEQDAIGVLLESVTYCSETQINAVLQIIIALVSYIVLQKMVFISEKPVGLQIMEYIKAHGKEDLTVATIGREFAMSRSQLYKVTAEYMPQGIAKFVKQCRMDAIRTEIAQNPDKPLWVVAQEYGFHNYEYFRRIYRKNR